LHLELEFPELLHLRAEQVVVSQRGRGRHRQRHRRRRRVAGGLYDGIAHVVVHLKYNESSALFPTFFCDLNGFLSIFNLLFRDLFPTWCAVTSISGRIDIPLERIESEND